MIIRIERYLRIAKFFGISFEQFPNIFEEFSTDFQEFFFVRNSLGHIFFFLIIRIEMYLRIAKFFGISRLKNFQRFSRNSHWISRNSFSWEFLWDTFFLAITPSVWIILESAESYMWSKFYICVFFTSIFY